jgi:curved DNA-binding protein
MQDLYSVLGVSRSATPDEIKRAYRKLASQHHPDKGGDTQRFQQIQSAYDVLGDPNKRSQYDNPQPQGFGPHGGFGPQGFGPAGFNFDNIFDMFGARFHHRPQQARMTLWIKLEDVATGGRKNVGISTSHGNQTIEIEIPRGLDDGSNVQYPGLAPGNMDLIVQYRIHPHAVWQRDNANLLTERAISVWDLVLGGEISVDTIYGNTVNLKIPPRTQPGTMLRMRGMGLPLPRNNNGDAFVKVQARLPEHISEELIAHIQQHRGQ